MPIRVLAATGGSTHSELALKLGAELAATRGAALTALTVVKEGDPAWKATGILSHAREVLGERLPAGSWREERRVGHPAEEIIAVAEEGNYDLVLLGERQHHRLMTRFFLGSTAARVVEHAPCPVVVVKGRVGPIDRLLLCDSGVQEAPLVDQLVARLPELLRGARAVTVLHVMSQMPAGPAVEDGSGLEAQAADLIAGQDETGRVLSRDQQLLSAVGVTPRLKVRHGLVAPELAAEAAEMGADLVVIGAHRGAGWRRILLSDLAHEILATLDRPVLVMRAPGAADREDPVHEDPDREVPVAVEPDREAGA